MGTIISVCSVTIIASAIIGKLLRINEEYRKEYNKNKRYQSFDNLNVTQEDADNLYNNRIFK